MHVRNWIKCAIICINVQSSHLNVYNGPAGPLVWQKKKKKQNGPKSQNWTSAWKLCFHLYSLPWVLNVFIRASAEVKSDLCQSASVTRVNHACLLFSPCCVAFICTHSRLGTAQQIHFPHCWPLLICNGPWGGAPVFCWWAPAQSLSIARSFPRARSGLDKKRMACLISDIAERWINKKSDLTANKQF